MQRYFITIDSFTNQNIVITGKDYHHIKNVMRMKINDRIILCNNNKEYLCKIDSLEGGVFLQVIEEKDNHNELPISVTIAQGLVRKEKCEEVLRRIVELGASAYVNVNMERCNVRLKDESLYKLTRFQEIVKECSEQSERGTLLEVKGLLSFNEFLRYASSFDLLYLAYEESGRNNSSSIYPLVKEMIGKKVLILVGPEGGVSPKELEILERNNFKCIGLGRRILRTETAPLYIMSVISAGADYLSEGDKE